MKLNTFISYVKTKTFKLSNNKIIKFKIQKYYL